MAEKRRRVIGNIANFSREILRRAWFRHIYKQQSKQVLIKPRNSELMLI